MEHKDFKTLDILLVGSKKGFLPKMIRKFTKSKYNHVAIVVEYCGMLYVAEAVKKGFLPTYKLEDWIRGQKIKGNSVCVKRKPGFMTIKDKDKYYQRVRQITGARYDYANLLFFQLIKSVFRLYIGNKNRKKVICSEAVAYVYLEVFPKWWKVSPDEIYKNEYFKEVLKYK